MQVKSSQKSLRNDSSWYSEGFRCHAVPEWKLRGKGPDRGHGPGGEGGSFLIYEVRHCRGPFLDSKRRGAGSPEGLRNYLTTTSVSLLPPQPPSRDQKMYCCFGRSQNLVFMSQFQRPLLFNSKFSQRQNGHLHSLGFSVIFWEDHLCLLLLHFEMM